jgi:putative AlgH/UPF0301 family transcriptional regulator
MNGGPVQSPRVFLYKMRGGPVQSPRVFLYKMRGGPFQSQRVFLYKMSQPESADDVNESNGNHFIVPRTSYLVTVLCYVRMPDRGRWTETDDGRIARQPARESNFQE